MSFIKSKIELLMHDSGVNRFFSLGSILYALSVCYGVVINIRTFLFEKKILKSKKLPKKVFSIGNLAVGGTGKTPMTIYLINLLNKLGYETVVISRGYMGTAEKNGGVVSTGKKILMGPDQAGDEPYMLSQILEDTPILVGQNRYDISLLAIKKFNPDVIILDDGFQHRKLSRDLDLVLLDHANPLGNGHLLPRGILREPVSALLRGDAFIFTRSDDKKNKIPDKLEPVIKGKPIFKSKHSPFVSKVIPEKNYRFNKDSNFTMDSFNEEMLKGQKIYAFSGIAQNKDFRKTLTKFGCQITGFSEFPDHHPYKVHEIRAICKAAKDSYANFIVTTEKDNARISPPASWGLTLVVIGVRITFLNQSTSFDNYIIQKLSDIV